MPKRHEALLKRRGPRRNAGSWAMLAAMVAFALVALARPFGRHGQAGLSPTGRVASVIDGDTITLTDGRHVRYIGMDSPEMDSPTERQMLLARRALDFNRELVADSEVRLEFDVETKDKYGRVLAYVWVDDKMANAQLVAAGLARARVYGANRKHSDELARLENLARAEGRGIWAAGQAEDARP